MNFVLDIRERELGLSRHISWYYQLSHLSCKLVDWGSNPDCEEFPVPVFASEFASQPSLQNYLLMANEEGHLTLRDTSKPASEPLTGFQAHDNSIFDIAWMPGESKVLSASGDQEVKLWDYRETGASLLQTFQKHIKSVKTVQFQPESKNVFVSGGRDSRIYLWDIRCPLTASFSRPESSISPAHCLTKRPGTPTPTYKCGTGRICPVTSLAFQDDFTIFSSSDADGCIKSWDFRRSYSAYRGNPEPLHKISCDDRGVSHLVFDRSSYCLFASCNDSTIYKFYVPAAHKGGHVQRYLGHHNIGFYMKCCLSPDGQYLLSGSTDGVPAIWMVDYPEKPICRLEGHFTDAEVNVVAWSPHDIGMLVTVGDDGFHGFWRLNPNIDKSELAGQSKLQKLVKTERATRKQSSSVKLTTTPSRRKCDAKLTQWLKSLKSGNSSVKRKREAHKENNYCSPSGISPVKKRLRLILSPKKGVNEGSSSKNQVTSSTGVVGDSSLLQSSASSSNALEELASRLEISPSKSSPKRRVSSRLEFSPLASTPKTQRSTPVSYSPTTNLPNFVLDGRSPHLPYRSGGKKRTNWLTSLSMEKKKSDTPESSSNQKLKTPESSAKSKAKASEGKQTKKRASKSATTKSLIHYFNKET